MEAPHPREAREEDPWVSMLSRTHQLSCLDQRDSEPLRCAVPLYQPPSQRKGLGGNGGVFGSIRSASKDPAGPGPAATCIQLATAQPQMGVDKADVHVPPPPNRMRVLPFELHKWGMMEWGAGRGCETAGDAAEVGVGCSSGSSRWAECLCNVCIHPASQHVHPC